MASPASPGPEATAEFDRAPGNLQVNRVAEAVERFAEAWRTAATPPKLAAYLPESPAIRRVSLIELIKVDLANRWRYGKTPKRLADYVEELPELRTWPLPPDLIYEEFHVRKQAGSSVAVAEYTAAYPEQSDQLSEMLATDDYHSTAMTVPIEPTNLDDLAAGQKIDDFDLMAGLGRGTFARVFLARQRSMQRLVAVKISRDSGTEPQTLAQLDHDYIVRIFDQRVLERRKLRLLYMQYVPGGTLFTVLERVRATPQAQRSGVMLLEVIDQVLAAKGEIRPSESPQRAELAELSWPETVAWLGRRLAEALDYAGNAGVLHRDVKPANVLLTADGVPKLADFNISFSGNVSGDNPIAYFGGSLAYMSPEQLAALHPDLPITANDLDTRSDLYALAVVLWELLTGRKPFDDDVVADDDRAALAGMLERRPRSPQALPYSDLPRDCPAALQRALVRALNPEPENRWARGADMAQQLEVCLDARARNLIDPPPTSWRLRARMLMHPIMALAIAVPNALALIYNHRHNHLLIIDNLDVQAQYRFEQVTFVAYGVGFLIGFVVINILIARLWSVARGLRKGRSYNADTLTRARADTLRLGKRTVLICCALWAITGVVVPVIMEATGNHIAVESYVYFFIAQIVCGVAMAYPYFLVTLYAVRSLYPMFLPHGGLGAQDAHRLHRLEVRSTYFLAAAAAVPLLGVAAATFIPSQDLSAVIVTLRLLCISSALAFIGVYWLFRILEKDLAALERIAARGA
ncbi:serine/threonine-protein kinase [Nocardia anaemiae]|uniref:serine/threonine-protein kinase n=1 Tax=Nocardia anaemiae TaxID=263910 RepID=UPI0009FC464D|nr:serine/threonine-protein kinase [Nocardia anaemiae]